MMYIETCVSFVPFFGGFQQPPRPLLPSASAWAWAARASEMQASEEETREGLTGIFREREEDMTDMTTASLSARS